MSKQGTSMHLKNRQLSFAVIVGTLSALAAPAFAEGAVKVECWGNCASVNLGQVCDTYEANSVPVAIACDDTADPGAGSRGLCGGWSTCTPFGAIVRADLLSAYCADGGGNDVIVTCR
jgi:hypothetical protein